ncbi:hypothetical protein GGI26_002866 [Coemansia sp. RSA 1358]|uniref:Mitotic-spindle organizing protein 1 n=1 Tax=Coemansia umbellata TaxID=1424467 RepID=A0ABQ8PRR6_9FUNG|nr:hypothetical protein EDC05_002461 [Coemansia umbellata]KAJ2622900.1 hypothetical protein GGI26_002866 [Coemansia sp. RSA 1358]
MSYNLANTPTSSDGDAINVLGELSAEIGAGLTKQQISVAMKLLRLGVNPSALVAITQELRKEAQYASSAQQATATATATATAQQPPTSTRGFY